MTLLSPIWLWLGLPALAAAWWWRRDSRIAWGLRLLVLLLILLSLAGLATQQTKRAGIVIAIADRSLSMPKDKELRQKEWIDQLHKSMGPLETLGVVSFGRRAVVEHAPQRGSFAGFERRVGADGSSLAQALEVALALIPTGTPGRIVLFSDGRWTGKDPAAIASQAAARGIALDYLSLARPVAHDIAIGRIEAPSHVAPGEAFMLSAWVHVPTSQRVRFVLKRGILPLVAGSRQLKAGANRLVFRDQADRQGVLAYELVVSAAPARNPGVSRPKDPTPENNKARFVIGVKGPRPVLHITTSGRSALAKLLKSGKMDVVSKKPQGFSWSLKELAQYSAVLLENVPSQKIGRRGMQNLASWVRHTGAGLMLTGGEESFGPGGYIRSPLEPILPVSMRLKQEHRKLFLSLAIVLDRSCSMGARVDDGRSKMDLANIASVQALDLLGPRDELAVLAVDTRPHEILPLSRITDKAALRQRILSIRPAGGGIFVYEGLFEAFRILKSAASRTRHIILFSDTNDSERPGDYIKLLAECRAQGITISVIGLGGKLDRDSALLKDIAKKGQGRIFFTRNAKELPRLFAQDTMLVTKSSFVRSETQVRWLSGRKSITQIDFPEAPAVGGYNMTYKRPGATLSMVTVSKKPAPLVASWQVGLGRVLAYTGEVDGQHAGEMARWEYVGDFLSSLVRWVAGHQQRLPTPMMLTQRLHRGQGIVELQLDPERFGTLLTKRPVLQVLRGDLGRKPTRSRHQMRWVAPHRLLVSIPLQGRETAVPTMLLPGMDPIALAPMMLPYSPEFRPASGAGARRKTQSSRTDLSALAQISQGKLRIHVADVWKDIPVTSVSAPIGHWLLLLAALLFLLELLERRAGFFVDAWWALFRRQPKAATVAPAPRPSYGLPGPAPDKVAARPAPASTIPARGKARGLERLAQGGQTATHAGEAAQNTAQVVAHPIASSAPSIISSTTSSADTAKGVGGAAVDAATTSAKEKAPGQGRAAAKPATREAPRGAKQPEAPALGMFGALQKASQQARRRTDRKPKE